MEWIKEHKCSLIAAKIKLAVTNQQKRNMIILVRAHKRLTKLKIWGQKTHLKNSLKTLKLKIVFCGHIGNKLEINLKI